MEEIFGTQYYTVGIWIILGAIIAAYIGAGYLWNKKLVPYRRMRGQATPKWGIASKQVINFAFKEDPRNIAPKKITHPLVKKILTTKTINWLLLGLTFLLIGVNKLDFAWIPAFVLAISIAAQTTAPLKKRAAVLNRMYAVAASSFNYGKDGLLNPWAYVQIKKWDGLVKPSETHLAIPANWDASSISRRDGLEAHFNTTVTDDNTWVYEWKTADGIVIAKPVAHIPTKVDYLGSEKYAWHQIPLGMGVDGDVVVDLQQAPHFLITGTTGSGKSVIQRNLVFHCIQHNDMWRFLGVDIKRVELSGFKKYSKTVMGIATNLEDGVEIVRYAKEVMEQRYEEMEQLSAATGTVINHFKDMKDSNGKTPYALLLMIDEAFMFLSPEGIKTDEGKMRDQLHGEATGMLGDIARLGRAAGVHLVVATQRPDATVIKGEFKQNLAIRVLAGRSDSIASSMTLDSGAGMSLPAIKGRGMVSVYGAAEQFQGYYADAEWIDKWLEKHPGVEPDLYPAGGSSDMFTSSDEENFENDLEQLAKEYDFEDGKIDPLPEAEPSEHATEDTTTTQVPFEEEPTPTETASPTNEPVLPATLETSPIVEETNLDSMFESLGFKTGAEPEQTPAVPSPPTPFNSSPATVTQPQNQPSAPRFPGVPSQPNIPQKPLNTIPKLPTFPQRPKS